MFDSEGEIFGGICVNSDCNDTEILMQALGECCFVNSHIHTRTPYCDENGQSSIPNVLSTIKGPWAVIYWQESSKTLWFARDAFGRRSLLVHWPTLEDCRFLLSSVSPVSSMEHNSGPIQVSISGPAKTVLTALRESVMRRTSLHRIFQAVTCDIRQEEHSPVAVLFSGGLDSMILAALLDECLDPNYEIDLLNVSFDGHSAPDRISAKAGVKELRRIAPLRRWKLVEIDADLSKLDLDIKHVMSLINPANTYMDLNIGVAFWLAARGSGCVYEGNSSNNNEDLQCVKYESKARIVLVGSGADEQCAGYGRHKTKYRQGSWLGLHKEMKLDMQRIWKRNLGRDDRCIADNGKEARFPFLDEDVIRTLLDIPLWEVANLDQPSGTGDKKILREVAKLLGLYEAAVLPKRAIQFGTRIARESNRKNFGSNRAANQASAGSAVIQIASNFS
ncbi:Asparagine synthetase domain-containing protein 1 [Morella rubra]|uniref:Asparagine synthetase domain-containing protein 1 n=1 Tax=Morella rubra TaxID=262757 RepID=A0A6A1V258_9ROSI|nr:Asparagine synthetase domain-containing protein 1 [Morella rubra]